MQQDRETLITGIPGEERLDRAPQDWETQCTGISGKAYLVWVRRDPGIRIKETLDRAPWGLEVWGTRLGTPARETRGTR